jgi:hypothetical protein
MPLRHEGTKVYGLQFIVYSLLFTVDLYSYISSFYVGLLRSPWVVLYFFLLQMYHW